MGGGDVALTGPCPDCAAGAAFHCVYELSMVLYRPGPACCGVALQDGRDSCSVKSLSYSLTAWESLSCMSVRISVTHNTRIRIFHSMISLLVELEVITYFLSDRYHPATVQASAVIHSPYRIVHSPPDIERYPALPVHQPDVLSD